MKHQNLILFLFFILFGSCVQEELNDCYYADCREDEICYNGTCITIEEQGFIANNHLKPSKIILTNFTVKRFPLRNFSGQYWDTSPVSAPDLFIQIVNGVSIIWETPTSYQNASSMPFTIPLSSPLEFTSNSGNININMYDDDGNGFDEFMGGATASVYDENGYPNLLNVDLGGTVGFSFDISYEF